MSVTSLIIAVVLVGTVVFVALLPLLESKPATTQKRNSGRGTLRQNQAIEILWDEKTRVLRAIRDLDFDYDMDKLPDSTYAAQRVHLIRLAWAITQRLDELEAEVAVQDARIEEAVAAFRQSNAVAKAK
ncbi:MAG: hypothetical protein GX573_15570 [Chloroflexi bacterium]|nr:hypothetical protein [Chloroflexota bacterium]